MGKNSKSQNSNFHGANSQGMISQGMIRSPICTVVGHVDHGKSSLLDYIRGTNIIAREAGAITQAIGASICPLSEIKKRAGKLFDAMKIDIKVPSLLFIDTPGHAAFTNLRKRGGNLADIAVVVIDINEGIKPQTKEAIEILINYRTPFIIALNKIDLVPGFKQRDLPLLELLNKQEQGVLQDIENKLYEIVGKVNELYNLQAERYDRVSDFTKQIAIVPISAKVGIGVPELLVMILGLAQRYLSDKLRINPGDYGKGTVLEVKTQQGMGTVMDVILYDGMLKVGDNIVIGSMDKPIVTRVKGLFEPVPLTEIMDKKAKFKPVKEVVAAVGVRITAKEIDNVISGMPLKACSPKDVDKVVEEITEEIKEVTINTDNEGVIVKADSLGSLEALVGMLKSKGIPIAKAKVGNVTKSDLIDAKAEKNPFYQVILGFNVVSEEEDNIKIITSNVIYHIIDEYDKWVEDKKIEIERKKMETLTPVAKIEILHGYVFRQNNPAVVGSEVLNGKIKAGMDIMNKEGVLLTEIKSIQKEGENVSAAEKGEQVAISMPNVTIGRQIKEGDILYSAINENEFREYKRFKEYLTGDEKALLKEIAEIMRRENPVWGV